MKIYYQIIMGISIVAVFISLLFFAVTVKNLVSPESSLGRYDYSKYTDFDKFRDEFENNIKYRMEKTKETIPPESEIRAKWESYRKRTIAAEKHDNCKDLYTEIMALFLFIILFGVHFLLYRRLKEEPNPCGCKE